MDLGIDLRNLSKPGRRLAAVDAEYLRDVGPSDLVALRDLPRGTEPVAIKRLSERHHTLARLLASGLKDHEAAAMVGYELPWVSSLKRSPAFVELLDLYRASKDLEYAEFGSRMAGLGKDALLELQHRLEEDPDKFSNGMLLDLAKTLADRTGFGPQTTQVNVNLDLGARLAAARERARAAMRDVTPADEGVTEPPQRQFTQPIGDAS